MKIRFVLIVNIIALFLISQFYLANSSSQTEDRSTFKVLYTCKNYEIRKYNNTALEAINSIAYRFKEYSRKDIKNRERFGMWDIKAANRANFSSSLVGQNISKPGIYTAENLATTHSEVYLAAITFDGFAFEKDIKIYAKTMAMALRKSNIRHFGNFHFVGYNSRFQFFKRKNEVLVHINYTKK